MNKEYAHLRCRYCLVTPLRHQFGCPVCDKCDVAFSLQTLEIWNDGFEKGRLHVEELVPIVPYATWEQILEELDKE
jgi:hypothetical protein